MGLAMPVSLFLGFILLPVFTTGYTYFEQLNTESGFCEGPGYNKIAVGEVGYSNEACEKILCFRGSREVLGCGKVIVPNDPACRLVEMDGVYPACCPTIKCDYNGVRK